jgi:hypothetical protein
MKFSTPLLDYAIRNATMLLSALEHDQSFQDANHTGDILHVQIQETLNNVPVIDPLGKPKLVPIGIKYYELIKELRQQKWKTFVIIDSFRNSLTNVITRPMIMTEMFLQ